MKWPGRAAVALFVLGGVAGIAFWGGVNTAMESTNTMEFCISCHEMKDTVFQEYKKSPHYTNASGVRATCPDCHVPREWGPKVVRKVLASNELYLKKGGKGGYDIISYGSDGKEGGEDVKLSDMGN